jgi:hypothetical protein
MIAKHLLYRPQAAANFEAMKRFDNILSKKNILRLIFNVPKLLFCLSDSILYTKAITV